MAVDLEGFDFSACEDRREAVFQGLGAASVCWDNMAGAGVFESEAAAAVGEGLLVRLAELDEKILRMAATRELLAELTVRVQGGYPEGVELPADRLALLDCVRQLVVGFRAEDLDEPTVGDS